MVAKLTLSEAARACNVARTTIQRIVRSGRLSLDAEHRIDTAELLRAGYQVDAAVLHAAPQRVPVAMQQNAAPRHSTTQQQPVAVQEAQLLRQERDALQRERDLLMQQVDMLRSMHQTTQQQLTHAQQMLHEMQHRYDRLLAAPRTAPEPQQPEPIAADTTAADSPPVRMPGGQHKLTLRQQRALRDKRQRGVPVPALMEEYGISRASVFRYLQSDKRSAQTQEE